MPRKLLRHICTVLRLWKDAPERFHFTITWGIRARCRVVSRGDRYRFEWWALLLSFADGHGWHHIARSVSLVIVVCRQAWALPGWEEIACVLWCRWDIRWLLWHQDWTCKAFDINFAVLVPRFSFHKGTTVRCCRLRELFRHDQGWRSIRAAVLILVLVGNKLVHCLILHRSPLGRNWLALAIATLSGADLSL